MPHVNCQSRGTPSLPALSPRRALSATTVHCQTLSDIDGLGADAMAALRLCGRLTVGSRAFSVALTSNGGKPQYAIRELQAPASRRTAPTAKDSAGQYQEARIGTALARRHVMLATPPYSFGDEALPHLCRAFAISRDLHVPSFSSFLDACGDGTRLRYGGQDYEVRVKPGLHGMADATVSLVAESHADSFRARLLDAVRHLFPRRCTAMSAASLERLLRAALRSYHAADGPVGPPPAPLVCRARVESAIRAAEVARQVAPLVKVDLSNANLAGADLKELNLKGANLRNANLTGANLRGADLSEADLTVATLTNAKMTEARMLGTRLFAASAQNARLDAAHLSRADLSLTNLCGASLMCTELSEAKLCGTHLSGATLANTRLVRADLTNAVFDGCTGTLLMFVGSNLSGARFNGAMMVRALFQGAVLNRASFVGARLARADFTTAVLTGANLAGADVAGAAFKEVAIGDGSCLSSVNLHTVTQFSIRIDNVDEALRGLVDHGNPLRQLEQLPGGPQTIHAYLLQLAGRCQDHNGRCALLREWLAHHPRYDTQQLRDIVLLPYRRARHTGRLPWPEVAPLLPGLMQDAIASLRAENGAAWARANGKFVSQLMVLGGRRGAPPAATLALDELHLQYKARLPKTIKALRLP